MQNRLAFSDQMTLLMTSKLRDILKVNPYCQFFRRLGDLPELISRKIIINCDAGLDQRVYNAPSASQVAAIWVDDDSSSSEQVHDIVVSAHSGDFHAISYFLGCCDPLQYPLLFPYGDTGWHRGIRKRTNRQDKAAIDDQDFIHVEQIASVGELISRENAGLLRLNAFLYFLRIKVCYRLTFLSWLFVASFPRERMKVLVSCREYYWYK